MLAKWRIDPQLFIPYILLVSVSSAMIFSVAPDRLMAQLIFVVIGLLLFTYLARQDQAVFVGLAPYCYPVAMLLLIITHIVGEPVRGAVRWLDIGSFQLQTSEIVKPLVILGFAHFLSRFNPTTVKNLMFNVAFILVPFLLIFFQPDLGTALVIASIAAFQVFLAGIPWKYIIGLLVVCTGVFVVSPHYLEPYQLARLESFVDPARDPLGSGYNVIQSVIAVGSGGVLGKGLGHGTQSHLKFLPERHTDFMFASLAEELGLIGACVVLLLLAHCIYRILEQAIGARGHTRLILAGVAGYLFFQTSVNIGMNLGVAPVTGVTLPLISYGGSSMVAVSLTLGIAASITRERPLSPTLEIV